MKKVITYGTFDLFHQGHLNLLRNAKRLGDYLIVGITSDSYDKERGKLNVQDSLIDRIESVKNTGLADKIIVEEFEGQKILDIEKYGVDVFAVGSDWVGKFDYLKEYCEVRYLERTKGISSTDLRNGSSLIRLGIIGTGRIASRFICEAHLVSGVEIFGVYNPNLISAKSFSDRFNLGFFTSKLEELLSNVNAVYIASPHQFHHKQTMAALNAGVHVLCEKPMATRISEIKESYDLARNKGLALVHAVKTAYCPGFEHLQILAKSGRIGKIVDVDASFTKIIDSSSREFLSDGYGGSVLELSSYPAFALSRLIGTDASSFELMSVFQSDCNNEKSEDRFSSVDIFTRGLVKYGDAFGSFKVGIGSKTEGSLIVTGTKGYIYAPAPWWKTEYFEMRFEDTSKTRKFFYSYDGDGLRYEILELVNLIKSGSTESNKLTENDTIFMTQFVESMRKKRLKMDHDVKQ